MVLRFVSNIFIDECFVLEVSNPIFGRISSCSEMYRYPNHAPSAIRRIPITITIITAFQNAMLYVQKLRGSVHVTPKYEQVKLHAARLLKNNTTHVRRNDSKYVS